MLSLLGFKTRDNDLSYLTDKTKIKKLEDYQNKEITEYVNKLVVKSNVKYTSLEKYLKKHKIHILSICKDKIIIDILIECNLFKIINEFLEIDNCVELLDESTILVLIENKEKLTDNNIKKIKRHIINNQINKNFLKELTIKQENFILELIPHVLLINNNLDLCKFLFLTYHEKLLKKLNNTLLLWVNFKDKIVNMIEYDPTDIRIYSAILNQYKTNLYFILNDIKRFIPYMSLEQRELCFQNIIKQLEHSKHLSLGLLDHFFSDDKFVTKVTVFCIKKKFESKLIQFRNNILENLENLNFEETLDLNILDINISFDKRVINKIKFLKDCAEYTIIFKSKFKDILSKLTIEDKIKFIDIYSMDLDCKTIMMYQLYNSNQIINMYPLIKKNEEFKLYFQELINLNKRNLIFKKDIIQEINKRDLSEDFLMALQSKNHFFEDIITALEMFDFSDEFISSFDSSIVLNFMKKHFDKLGKSTFLKIIQTSSMLYCLSNDDFFAKLLRITYDLLCSYELDEVNLVKIYSNILASLWYINMENCEKKDTTKEKNLKELIKFFNKDILINNIESIIFDNDSIEFIVKIIKECNGEEFSLKIVKKINNTIENIRLANSNIFSDDNILNIFDDVNIIDIIDSNLNYKYKKQIILKLIDNISKDVKNKNDNIFISKKFLEEIVKKEDSVFLLKTINYLNPTKLIDVSFILEKTEKFPEVFEQILKRIKNKDLIIELKHIQDLELKLEV